MDAYVKSIDNARKAVAIAMAVCGLGLVVSANRLHELESPIVGEEPRIWQWGCAMFGCGVVGCLIATLALVVEFMSRPAIPKPFTWRSLRVLVPVSVVFLAMIAAYGFGQAIGAVIASIFLLGARRGRGWGRAVTAVLGAIVLGLIAWSTQSSYQYARWHADAFIAAAHDMMDRFPVAHEGGVEIQLNDSRVPNAFRLLGNGTVEVEKDCVRVRAERYSEFVVYPKFVVSPNRKADVCGGKILVYGSSWSYGIIPVGASTNP
jgi:hypothetical protein